MIRIVKLVCIPLVLIFLVSILHISPGYIWDQYCWRDWAVYIHRHGLGNIYASGTDYLPLYHYVLWLYGLIAGSEQEIISQLHYLRISAIIFDVVGLWFVYKWIDKRVSFSVIFLLCMLNIGFIYNSAIWGQVDSILTVFIFISLYYGFYNKPVPSAIFFLLALNFKLQAIVFFPVWSILYLNCLLNGRMIKTACYTLVAVVLLQVMILAPFIANSSLGEVYRVVTGSVDKYPVITKGAKNIWSFVFLGQTRNVPDSGIFIGGISYKRAGLYMFFAFSFIALLPMLIQIFKRIKDRSKESLQLSKQQLWLTAALVSIFFYFFNTQMHERYAHPAFIFIVAYAFSTRSWFPFFMFSAAYFLALEDEMHFMDLSNYETLIFNDMFIAGLYVVIIVYLLVKLFRQTIVRKDHNRPNA